MSDPLGGTEINTTRRCLPSIPSSFIYRRRTSLMLRARVSNLKALILEQQRGEA